MMDKYELFDLIEDLIDFSKYISIGALFVLMVSTIMLIPFYIMLKILGVK